MAAARFSIIILCSICSPSPCGLLRAHKGILGHKASGGGGSSDGDDGDWEVREKTPRLKS